ncbi:membrane progestin receptor alpha-B-like [Ciona intestinalis]
MKPTNSDDEKNNNVLKQLPDENDFLHALHNDHSTVPQCTVAKYVVKGYVLPHMPWRYYVKSLFLPSNELLNIWTHLIPGLYFIKMLFRYNETIDLVENWPLSLTIISSITVMMCSALMHTFHSRSMYDHACWMMLDFFGIVFYAFGSTVAHFYGCSELHYYQSTNKNYFSVSTKHQRPCLLDDAASSPPRFEQIIFNCRIGWWNLLIFMFNCTSVFACCCNTKVGQKNSDEHFTRFLRIASVGGGYIYGHLPLMHRLYTSGLDEAMVYHIISTVCLTTAVVVYLSDFPQRWFSGTFDIIGQSHQLFHVLSALCCYFDILAVEQDMLASDKHWSVLSVQPDTPSLLHVFTAAILLIIFSFKFATRCLRNHGQRIGVCPCLCCKHTHPKMK